MKVTIQINGIDTDIELTPEQVANVEAQQKPKKFEWGYTDGVALIMSTSIADGRGSNSDYLEHGMYRKSEEVAERSLLRNKRANRLEALVEQLGGLKEFVLGEENYSLYHSTKASSIIWYYRSHNYSFSPCEVYMTEECAIEIRRMLNEGEFSLDGEL